jgi:hypothetical protein
VELRWDEPRSSFAATLLRAASPAHRAGFSFRVAVRIATDRVLACTFLGAMTDGDGAAAPALDAAAAIDWVAAALARTRSRISRRSS